MEQTIRADVSYVAFVLGYDFLRNALDSSAMATDEAYDYCVKLAEEFEQSEYDDECSPVYDCIERYANDKMPFIKEYIKVFDMSIGRGYPVPEW